MVPQSMQDKEEGLLRGKTGHAKRAAECPLSGGKRTRGLDAMASNDPSWTGRNL
jgi:hypothetical protein